MAVRWSRAVLSTPLKVMNLWITLRPFQVAATGNRQTGPIPAALPVNNPIRANPMLNLRLSAPHSPSYRFRPDFIIIIQKSTTHNMLSTPTIPCPDRRPVAGGPAYTLSNSFRIKNHQSPGPRGSRSNGDGFFGVFCYLRPPVCGNRGTALLNYSTKMFQNNGGIKYEFLPGPGRPFRSLNPGPCREFIEP